MSEFALKLTETRWRITGPPYLHNGFWLRDRLTVDRDDAHIYVQGVDESTYGRYHPVTVTLDGMGAHELARVLTAVADRRHIIYDAYSDPVIVSAKWLRVVIDALADRVPADALSVDPDPVVGAVVLLREVIA